MTSQRLFDKDGVGGTPEWQKHVVCALWILLGLLLAVGAIFLYAEAHGSFSASADHAAASWPVGWP